MFPSIWMSGHPSCRRIAPVRPRVASRRYAGMETQDAWRPPPLENALLTRVARGDPRAEEELLEHYYYLVRTADRTWRSKCRWVEGEDLEQLAELGLLAAVRTYDP